MAEYATIALDLKEYGFAAEFFWTLFLLGDKNEKSLAIDGFLYCIHKLKVSGIIENFAGNHASRWERVERGYEERKKNSALYNAMKKK